MAFETARAGQVFRTKTAGDFLIGKVMELDESGNNPCLVVETYEDEKRPVVKDGKETTEFVPRTFLVYDLNIAREYQRRLRRIDKAKDEARKSKSNYVPEKRNASKYVLVTCKGATDNGQYGVFEAAFSDNPKDMQEEHASRGHFYVFNEIPKEERPQKVRDNGGGAKDNGGAGSDGAGDEEFPF